MLERRRTEGSELIPGHLVRVRVRVRLRVRVAVAVGVGVGVGVGVRVRVWVGVGASLRADPAVAVAPGEIYISLHFPYISPISHPAVAVTVELKEDSELLGGCGSQAHLGQGWG